jgi:hypothetical protein
LTHGGVLVADDGSVRVIEPRLASRQLVIPLVAGTA